MYPATPYTLYLPCFTLHPYYPFIYPTPPIYPTTPYTPYLLCFTLHPLFTPLHPTPPITPLFTLHPLCTLVHPNPLFPLLHPTPFIYSASPCLPYYPFIYPDWPSRLSCFLFTLFDLIAPLRRPADHVMGQQEVVDFARLVYVNLQHWPTLTQCQTSVHIAGVHHHCFVV